MKSTIPHPRIDWLAYDRWTGSDKDFAQSIGMDPNNFAQYKRRHLRTTRAAVRTKRPTIVDVPIETVELIPSRNGDLPAIPAHSDALQRTSALPAHPSASELDAIRDRLATLEAFMSAIQSAHHSASERISALPAHSDAPAHRSAPQRTEPPVWIGRGTDIAQDMRDAIDAYAARHRLEKREVLDLALRTFFAQVGQAVHDA